MGYINSFVHKIFVPDYEQPGVDVEAALPKISKEAALMFKTALRGDWDTAEKLFKEDDKLTKAAISSTLDRPLHAAVGTGTSNVFVQNLLDRMGNDDEALALMDCNGETALHHAARVGNREAAIMLVNRKPDMMYMLNSYDRLPVQLAEGVVQ